MVVLRVTVAGALRKNQTTLPLLCNIVGNGGRNGAWRVRAIQFSPAAVIWRR